MPVRKQEAHRALELLEEYHGKLNRFEDRQLKEAIERVITIFKSRLFQALLDIQEFYEETLLNEHKTLTEKTNESNQIASKWEICPPIVSPSSGLYSHKTNGSVQYAEEWEFEDVVLEKGTQGLGFSIAGGSDNPHVQNDSSIFVTKIIDGGAAAYDGRMRVGDVILRVNTTDTIDVPHHVAVDALRRAGNVVKLFVKRRRNRCASSPVPPINMTTITANTYKALPRGTEVIELIKGNKGLGFSIAGGIGNEHIPGDTGIFVTKIIDGGAAQADGRLQVGDKLIAVGNDRLEDVAHETAVGALRATSDRVVLTVIKNPHPPETNGGVTSNSFYETSTTPTPAYDGWSNYQSSRVETTQVLRPQSEIKCQPSPYVPIVQSTTTEMTRSPRKFTLLKSCAGLGFNIVGGEDGEGIYVSYIQPGGVADVSGQLFKGDQLLQVNDVDLRGASHDIAAKALKNSGPNVLVMAQYKPDEYNRFEAKIEEIRNEMISQGTVAQSLPSPRKELYVRALFDYDPSKDSGLPSRGLAFNYGDILHVTNASDDEWWQARRILTDGHEEGYGIIPSKKRIEKRERARRKQVNFIGGRQSSMSEKHSMGKKSLSLSRKFPFMKSKERMNDESDIERMEDSILSYEVVEEQRLNYVRPVVILGPLKDRINDDLLSQYPERFGSCVPHTSRLRKDNEIDGKDYFFVSRDAMENDIQNHLFIEAGQYNSNLYGTSIASVKAVAQQGRHCILDVSGNAIKRLQIAGLYPVAILIKPYNWQQLMEWNRRLTDEEAQQQFHRTQMIEQEFGEAFTAILQGDTPEELYLRVQEIIREQSGPVIWVPSRDQI
uniref:Uncharacterized protein n=1 Tax=Romanomermis culicivorax TaxID=13658 RepID=A0A915HF84_ROMCU